MTLLAALGLAAPSSATCQSRLSSAIDTTRITVGDRIALTVSVEHAPDARVVWPDSLTLSPFETLDARALEPRAAQGATVSTLVLSLTAFELGELEIPGFEVAVVDAAGSTEVLHTDRFGVEVVSVGTDEGGDIRGIRGPLSLPVGSLWLLGLFLLVAVPALLAFLLYRRFRPRPPEEAIGRRGPPPRPAHEIALEALSELERSALLERGEVKEYHIRVSEILRTYVERRFRVDALEMTTVEVLAGLERAGVDPEVRDGLKRFLDQCDLVKFAKARPDADGSRAALRLGRELVQGTIPIVPIPDVDVGADSSGDEPGPGAEAGDAADTVGVEGR